MPVVNGTVPMDYFVPMDTSERGWSREVFTAQLIARMLSIGENEVPTESRLYVERGHNDAYCSDGTIRKGEVLAPTQVTWQTFIVASYCVSDAHPKDVKTTLIPICSPVRFQLINDVKTVETFPTVADLLETFPKQVRVTNVPTTIPKLSSKSKGKKNQTVATLAPFVPNDIIELLRVEYQAKEKVLVCALNNREIKLPLNFRGDFHAVSHESKRPCYTLEEIVDKFPLPQQVRCTDESIWVNVPILSRVLTLHHQATYKCLSCKVEGKDGTETRQLVLDGNAAGSNGPMFRLYRNVANNDCGLDQDLYLIPNSSMRQDSRWHGEQSEGTSSKAVGEEPHFYLELFPEPDEKTGDCSAQKGQHPRPTDLPTTNNTGSGHPECPPTEDDDNSPNWMKPLHMFDINSGCMVEVPVECPDTPQNTLEEFSWSEVNSVNAHADEGYLSMSGRQNRAAAPSVDSCDSTPPQRTPPAFLRAATSPDLFPAEQQNSPPIPCRNYKILGSGPHKHRECPPPIPERGYKPSPSPRKTCTGHPPKSFSFDTPADYRIPPLPERRRSSESCIDPLSSQVPVAQSGRKVLDTYMLASAFNSSEANSGLHPNPRESMNAHPVPPSDVVNLTPPPHRHRRPRATPRTTTHIRSSSSSSTGSEGTPPRSKETLPASDFKGLSVAELGDFLRSVKLDQLAETCEKQLVDGDMFDELDDQDFAVVPFCLTGLNLKKVVGIKKRGWRPKQT